jgi:hypothetical protein
MNTHTSRYKRPLPPARTLFTYNSLLPIRSFLSERLNIHNLLRGLDRKNDRVFFADINGVLDANAHSSEMFRPSLIIGYINATILISLFSQRRGGGR